MPYIHKERRSKISGVNLLDETYIVNDEILCAGDIQYAIAIIVKSYIKRNGLNYQKCNDVMGALSGAQMEFYRKVVAPYEEKKIIENGDV